MKDKFTKRQCAGSTGPYRFILPILVIASVTACAAMEGVNVGANIPLGGVVNIGASKTIGESQAPAPKQKKAREKSEESAPEEE